MKEHIKKILKKTYYYLPLYHLPIKFLLKNYILFESNPDYADNAYYVYLELLKQGYNKKYKLIWLVDNDEEFKDINIHNVIFLNRNSKEARKCKILAKFIIDCNKYIYKFNKYQYRFHMGHGMPIKDVSSYTGSCNKVDNYLITSEFFLFYFLNCIKLPKEKYLSLGFPRTDEFFMEKEHFEELDGYDKLILWMPTYRNHFNDEGKKSKLKYGVPSINTKKELVELNDILKNSNSLLIIKLHPSENTDILSKMELSNILFTKNELLEKNHRNIYQLAHITDALITDYSSIYFDYLLMNKPIAMAIEDIKEYSKEVPLLYDDFEKVLPAEYIYNYDDLIKFINNVCSGKDIKKKERNEKLSTYMKHNDGNSAKRIIEILKKHSL